MNHAASFRILVASASDRLGHRVVELLLRRDNAHVTAISQEPMDLVDLAARGAGIREFDIDDIDSLNDVLVNVNRILLVSTATTGTLTNRQHKLNSFIYAAADAGVQSIILAMVSDPISEEIIDLIDYSKVQQTCESRGIRFTILSTKWYLENLFARVSLSLRVGKWLTSAADGKLECIAREEVARVIVSLLCSDDLPQGRRIAGTLSLAPEEIVNAINVVFGASVKLVAVSDEVLSQHLRTSGMPMPWIERSMAMERAALRGGVDVVSGIVTRIPQSESRGLVDFLAANRIDLLLASKSGEPWFVRD